MRIALVTEFYYPHLGGVTEHVHHLARLFNAAGHPTIVVTGRMQVPIGTPDADEYEQDDDFVRRWAPAGSSTAAARSRGSRPGWGLRRQLGELFRASESTSCTSTAASRRRSACRARSRPGTWTCPVVATFHSWFPAPRSRGRSSGRCSSGSIAMPPPSRSASRWSMRTRATSTPTGRSSRTGWTPRSFTRRRGPADAARRSAPALPRAARPAQRAGNGAGGHARRAGAPSRRHAHRRRRRTAAGDLRAAGPARRRPGADSSAG